MSEAIKANEESCAYCGHSLDARVYFCPGCSKPHRPVEMLLTPSAPAYEDIETSLRTKTPDVWTVFFGFMTALVVSGSVGAAIWGLENREPMMLLVSFTLLVVTSAFTVRYWQDVKPQLTRFGFFSPATWAGLTTLAPMLLLNFGYHSLLVALLDIKMPDYMEFFTSASGAIIFICIMPAVVEELAFRGIIQNRFEKVVGPWIAIGVASALFSVAHFTILSAPYLFLLGMLLGWMKWKSGSLYPPMLAHFLHNFIVIQFFPK